ncbi:L-ascorbate oxidase-like protein [Senna tora]|uniref:L-ascorbate oxidase-like protein n=1 Tax=Senna tora TaxID=362788 RepID=A0A834W4X1_9FABA|nr:L-ascorbate oxidase-like protein [Senna tora]
MKQATLFKVVLVGVLACVSALLVGAEDRYLYFTWEVTYGTVYPLGFAQQGILINGQFPGPTLDAITNDNILVNVINKLDEPFLITWNGIKQRRTSWEDGVLGTNCPIPPNTNWTYKFQVKDQIGTYNYFPSTKLQRVAGGFGAFNIAQRSVISIPYPAPAAEFTILVSDWYNTNHKLLSQRLDAGVPLPFPIALLINGQQSTSVFTAQQGKTYKFRVSNVGIATCINLRIQGHSLKVIEVEGSHTIQEVYESFDVHVGQSVAFLVTLNGSPKDYYIVASSRFSRKNLTAIATLRYEGSNSKASGPLPPPPSFQLHGSMKQARTIRLNLTANAARPNPQGSFHYGTIKITRTIILENSEARINGKRRYAVNGISHVNPETPLKLADWFGISGVFDLNIIKDVPPPSGTPAKQGASVIGLVLHDFIEIVFQNNENALQSWHMDGSSFYVVGAIMVALDNKGMWNLRSAIWGRQYLGQELYLMVDNGERSILTETNIPSNALLCGKAKAHN